MAFGDFTVTRASTKNILGSNGLIQSVANNVPAFEFNTDGSYRGLLVEPGATNLFERSQELDDAYWAKVTASVTANTDTAPDGTLTADTVDSDGGRVQRSIGVTSGTVYTVSVFAKKKGGTTFRIAAIQAVVSSVDFDLVAGTLSATASSGTITALPNDYYRCTMTFTATATASIAIRIAQNADNVIIWQAQLETGSVATSPIVTTAGTASRVADVVTLASASSLIGQAGSGGTIYAEVEWRTVAGTPQNILAVSDGTGTNRVLFYGNGAVSELNMLITANNVMQTSQGQSYAGYSGIQKIALAYATNDAKLYRNGASISTDTVIDLSALASLTRVNIGSRPGNDDLQANMWIRSVALFPTPLADAQLASITTL
jgi:hypothetical protein